MIIREMSRTENVAVLEACRLGQLACARNDRPYVVPVHYAYADNHIYSFSMQGQKVAWMRDNPQVCLLVCDFAGNREWRSVVVHGFCEELPETPQWSHERSHAWSLLQRHANWWEPGGIRPLPQSATGKSEHLFYRIRIESLSGRQAIDETAPLA